MVEGGFWYKVVLEHKENDSMNNTSCRQGYVGRDTWKNKPRGDNTPIMEVQNPVCLTRDMTRGCM